MDDVGLKCHSTHNNGPSFTDDGLKKAIELNQIIGSKYLIMASAPRATGIDTWKGVAEQLTTIAAKLKPLGMATGYHNHQVEWRPIDGQRPMDVIAAGTPKDVVLSSTSAHASKSAPIRSRGSTRTPAGSRASTARTGRRDAATPFPFGEGDAPWKKIFDAAEKKGGVEYYLIEQETGGPDGELGMVQRCLDNWKKLRA